MREGEKMEQKEKRARESLTVHPIWRGRKNFCMCPLSWTGLVWTGSCHCGWESTSGSTSHSWNNTAHKHNITSVFLYGRNVDFYFFIYTYNVYIWQYIQTNNNNKPNKRNKPHINMLHHHVTQGKYIVHIRSDFKTIPKSLSTFKVIQNTICDDNRHLCTWIQIYLVLNPVRPTSPMKNPLIYELSN